MIHLCLSDILKLKRLPLGELGYFYGGLSGKSKEDFVNGNGRFIPYMNVFSNLSVDMNNLGCVKVAEGERQNKVEYGDVLFTGSSETPDECGMSSVMLEMTEDAPVYLNSFCFGFRFNDLSQIYPAFLKHLFRSNKIRKEISKTANGVTRFNISKKLFAKIQIPVPSIEQQKVIADNLDAFSILILNLDEEIGLRQKQYEYALDRFFGSNLEDAEEIEKKTDLELKCLDKIGSMIRGKRFVREDIVDEGVPCIHYGDMYTTYGMCEDKTKTFLKEEKAKKLRFAHNGDVVIVGAGENDWDIGVGMAWMGEDAAVHDACYIFKHYENPKYISYFLRSNNYHRQIRGSVSTGKICSISARNLGKAKILMPKTLDEQTAVVEKLDAFTSLIFKLQEERDLRQKQYEYYREKLLTFE